MRGGDGVSDEWTPSDPPVRHSCVRCNVPLLACEIRNEISWCAECWDIAFPNGKAMWPIWR